MNSNLHLARMIIGSSFATCKMRDLISSVANYNVAVMAQGPTGAGKELVARGVHMMSGRKGKLVLHFLHPVPPQRLETVHSALGELHLRLGDQESFPLLIVHAKAKSTSSVLPFAAVKVPVGPRQDVPVRRLLQWRRVSREPGSRF